MLKIASWNVNSLNVRLPHVLAWCDVAAPDILALQEIENRAILERLRSDYLSAADYRPPILIEGHDARGIDVAFLSRLELAEPATLYPIPFEDVDDKRIADTRGALEATFVLPDGSLLTGYSVHFPAPFHPTIMREFAYKHLNELRRNLPQDRLAFAAGDFNTTATEDRDKSMLDRFARPDWTVVHDEPCEGCRGTTYYRPNDEWSYLDMILWSPAENRGANATWGIRAKSMQIANKTPDQMLADGTPSRYQLPAGTGVSDHWPLTFVIENK